MGTHFAERTHVLNSRLESLIRSEANYPCEMVSSTLLYGLDHFLVSPSDVADVLQSLPVACPSVRARFAARLISHGHTALWEDCWAQDQVDKDLLLLSAVDSLGNDGISLAAEHVQRDATIFPFLRSWNGGSPERDQSASCRQEQLLDLAKTVAPLTALLVIVGFSAAGKSTLIEQLKMLKINAVDGDRLDDSVNDTPISGAFEAFGAIYARVNIYQRLVSRILAGADLGVLAIGSSTTCIPDARRLIASTTGQVALARTSADVAIGRIRVDEAHPLNGFVRMPNWESYLSQIHFLRSDHYYMADSAVNTDQHSIVDWYTERWGLNG